MYYKLYRRRKFIYISLLLLGILAFVWKSNSPNNTKNNIIKNEDEKDVEPSGEEIKDHRLKRINMENYKEPEPCIGCPGEGGSPVFLSVSLYSLFLFFSYSFVNASPVCAIASST
jgi:polyferredoxin